MKPGSLKPGDKVYVYDPQRPEWRGLATVIEQRTHYTDDGLDVTMMGKDLPGGNGAVMWWEECYATEEEMLRAVILDAAGVKASVE